MDSLAKDAGTLWLTIIISHYSERYNNRYKVVLTLCFKSKQQKIAVLRLFLLKHYIFTIIYRIICSDRRRSQDDNQ